MSSLTPSSLIAKCSSQNASSGPFFDACATNARRSSESSNILKVWDTTHLRSRFLSIAWRVSSICFKRFWRCSLKDSFFRENSEIDRSASRTSSLSFSKATNESEIVKNNLGWGLHSTMSHRRIGGVQLSKSSPYLVRFQFVWSCVLRSVYLNLFGFLFTVSNRENKQKETPLASVMSLANSLRSFNTRSRWLCVHLSKRMVNRCILDLRSSKAKLMGPNGAVVTELTSAMAQYRKVKIYRARRLICFCLLSRTVVNISILPASLLAELFYKPYYFKYYYCFQIRMR